MIERNFHTATVFRVFMVALLVVSCSARNYVTQEFAFPPDIKPHEAGWKYRGTVKIAVSGPWLELNSKAVEIFILDGFGREVLLDRIRMAVGGLRANIIWNAERELVVELIEEGDPNAEGKYNSYVLQRGRVVVRRLRYDPLKLLEK